VDHRRPDVGAQIWSWISPLQPFELRCSGVERVKAVKAAAHELSDQMQAFIGYVELGENDKAVAMTKKIFSTMHMLVTALAVKIAEADQSFSILDRQLADAAQRLKRGKS